MCVYTCMYIYCQTNKNFCELSPTIFGLGLLVWIKYSVRWGPSLGTRGGSRVELVLGRVFDWIPSNPLDLPRVCFFFFFSRLRSIAELEEVSSGMALQWLAVLDWPLVHIFLQEGMNSSTVPLSCQLFSSWTLSGPTSWLCGWLLRVWFHAIEIGIQRY